jgi:hypothetical protein
VKSTLLPLLLILLWTGVPALGYGQDTTPPTVVSVSPPDGAIDILVTTSRVRIEFSEPMDRSTFRSENISVSDPAGNRIGGCAAPAETFYEVFFCLNILEPETTYTVTVTTDVTDAAGNALASPFTSSFTTGLLPDDAIRPTVASVTPPDGATDVPPALLRVRVEFSEPMDRSTFRSENISVSDPAGNRVGGCAGISETVYEVVFCGRNLEPQTTYTVTVTTDVTDASDNPLGAPFASTFTTGLFPDDGMPPIVESVAPPDGAVAVPTTLLRVQIFFSEWMDRSTFRSENIFVTDPASNRIGGCAASSANLYEVVFCGNILEPETTYLVTVTTDVRDALGNPLEAPFTSSFTTAKPDIDVAPPFVDFGDVPVGDASIQTVTIVNLGPADLTVSAVSLPAQPLQFALLAVPNLPHILPAGQELDIELAFEPTAVGFDSTLLLIENNDPAQPIVEVLLEGTGVVVDPTDDLADILSFFDQSVLDGTLVGSGPGASGENRLNALRNKLEAAGDILDKGLTTQACNILLDAFFRSDGVFPPPARRSWRPASRTSALRSVAA